MTALGLVFVSGLLGSSHCLGMCGGFVLALSRPSESLSFNVRRQLCYTMGRVSTYGLLGAMAGWCGQEFLRWQPWAGRGGPFAVSRRRRVPTGVAADGYAILPILCAA